MRLQQTIFGLAALGLVPALAGCERASRAETQNRGAAVAGAEAGLERVTVGPPTREPLQVFTAQPGRIDAFEETPLYPKLAGFIDELLVDIGDPVTKGQMLVRLSIPELANELDQKKALVAQVDAEIGQAESAVLAAKAALQATDAGVLEAEARVLRTSADYERWKAEHTRMEELAGGGSVTRKLVDEALHQFRGADAARQESTAAVQSAKAAVNQAQANTAKAEADVVAVRARLNVAEADLARTQTLIGYTQIAAPFDGVVTRRNVDTGHYVQPATGQSKPLIVVARDDLVRVFVDVPELESGLIDAGDPATVQVQALRGREFEGKVVRTGWALDPANRSLRVEIDLPNEEGRLRPGMFATVRILLEDRASALTLPASAIVREGGRTFCCLVEEGRIVRRPVALRLRSGERVEIASGLTGDEAVVLARAEGLQEGQPVEIIAPPQK